MRGYYAEKLSSDRLRRAYDIATPRVRQYLDAEIAFVLKHIASSHTVLELGCGYGRALTPLAAKAAHVIGIDSSYASLADARRTLPPEIDLALMDAAALGFADDSFDIVVCIQNGISAFHVDQRRLIEEAMRVTCMGGYVLFSTYSEKFWDHRLHWFELQAKEGLLGEIDYDATGDGVIVCKDGFTATTVTSDRFRELCDGLEAEMIVKEVDNSSLFCVLRS